MEFLIFHVGLPYMILWSSPRDFAYPEIEPTRKFQFHKLNLVCFHQISWPSRFDLNNLGKKEKLCIFEF